MESEPHQVTRLLRDWRSGRKEAGQELFGAVYSELRRLAASYMRYERSSHTLQPTALVHELYMKLLSGQSVDWQDRAHFFAVAAQQLRRLLVDHARASHAQRRGGGQVRLSLEDVQDWIGRHDQDVIELDEALSRLEGLDPRSAKVIEMRFFGGLTEQETAEALNISVATMKRDWTFARDWLVSQLTSKKDTKE
ncbi:MAG: sigma-70 family RNA polymerase sigma factor [Bryobacteraceae bacterium]